MNPHEITTADWGTVARIYPALARMMHNRVSPHGTYTKPKYRPQRKKAQHHARMVTRRSRYER